MAAHTIYFQGTREQAKAMILAAIAAVTGKGGDPTGLVQQLQLLVGMQALSLIKEAYVVKAQGGTDEAGESWPPLSPKTIAYSRRHPGLEAIRKKAANEGRPGRPLLTAGQDKAWRTVFASHWHWYVKQGASDASAKAHAAAVAWIHVKAMGGQTILGVYGSVHVEILRDMGILLNSLSPGVTVPAHPNQIFVFGAGFIIIGTNVPYAAAHHYGVPSKNLPQRRLWPKIQNWPNNWWTQIVEAARFGLTHILIKMLGN